MAFETYAMPTPLPKIVITQQRHLSESVLWYQYICGKVCFRWDYSAYMGPHINTGLTQELWCLWGFTITSAICLMLAGYIYTNCSHTFDSHSNPFIITSVSSDLNAKAKYNRIQAPKPYKFEEFYSVSQFW